MTAKFQPRLLRGGRQELVVDQGLQPVTERVLGVNRPCEPGLAQLDGAHEGSRSFRGAVGEREIRVLVPVANQLSQVPRAKKEQIMPRSPRLPPLCRSPFKPSRVSDFFISG